MKLEEMKKIAEARTEGHWCKELFAIADDDTHSPIIDWDSDGPHWREHDGRFIAMAANNWDKLIAVVEAAKKHIPSEGNYVEKMLTKEIGYDRFAELKDALKELERGE